MRILILGSGVVGVASAYYLAKAGHEVTVLDRQPAAGLETSFANAGQVSPGYSAPWAAPGIPVKAMKWLMMRHRPLVLWPSFEPRFYGWLARMLANCTAGGLRAQQGPHGRPRRIQPRRAARSARRDRHRLRSPHQRHAAVVPHAKAGRPRRRRHEGARTPTASPTRYWTPRVASAPNPRLARVRHLIAGGLRLPGDETGDAHLFTQRLATLCETSRRRLPLRHDRRGAG